MKLSLGLLLLGATAASSACNWTTMKEGDQCQDKWANLAGVLHPTQEAVGYAWIQRKLKDFGTQSDAQKEMDDSPTPFVMGPNNVPYIVDDHHTISALHASGFNQVLVTLHMVCDWSATTDLDAFFEKLHQAKFVYSLGRPAAQPNALPVPGSAQALIPRTVQELRDDPWRALAGYARKSKDAKCPTSSKYCLRAFDRECETSGESLPFFEFRWAYFMNEAFNNNTLWDDKTAGAAFAKAYDKLPFPAVIGKEDTTAWQTAADHLVNLCRSDTAGAYRFPATLGWPFAGSALPGYVKGMVQINHDDPDCQIPVCPNLDSYNKHPSRYSTFPGVH